MTKKNEELLLKDLCARLQYRVKVFAQYQPTGEWFDGELIGIDMVNEPSFNVQFYNPVPYVNWCGIKEIKPYLRPIKSMTAEERKAEENTVLMYLGDFYNTRHIDFHKLIKKGLALEAPEDMYKTEDYDTER